jgi:hypothetical protein
MSKELAKTHNVKKNTALIAQMHTVNNEIAKLHQMFDENNTDAPPNDAEYPMLLKEELQTVIETAESFITPLTKEERSDMSKIGTKMLAFADSAYQQAENHPTLVPTFVDVDLWNQYSDAYHEVLACETFNNELTNLIRDQKTLVGFEYYKLGREFYRCVLQEVKDGVAGAESVADALKPYFAKPRNNENNEEHPGDCVCQQCMERAKNELEQYKLKAEKLNSRRYNLKDYEKLLKAYNLKVKLAKLHELEQIHGSLTETMQEDIEKHF